MVRVWVQVWVLKWAFWVWWIMYYIFGFRVKGLGFGAWSSHFTVLGSGYNIEGVAFKGLGLGVLYF